MKILGYTFFEKKQEVVSPQPQSKTYNESSNVVVGYEYAVVNKKWDGEKNLGELGSVVRRVPDYKKLRLRSYDAYATIDTVKAIASKFVYLTIGQGLKLQAEPNTTVLESEGVNVDEKAFAEFRKSVEARFMIWANSKECDYKKEKNLHELANDFYKGSFLGGDDLCIVRYSDYGPNIQYVSGEHLCSPGLDNDYHAKAEKDGGYIEDGIEFDKDGREVAYFIRIKVKNGLDKYERVPAFGEKSKKRLAWIVSGTKISPDHNRAVPEMSQSLEKINKLDRYIEAAVTKAEQAANLVYTIEHEEFSTGENVLDEIVAKKRGETVTSTDPAADKILADGLANKIAQQTSGMAYNMPIGSKFKAFESKIETDFSGFHDKIFDSISSGQDLPPEVAKQSFNSNYSASRAAIMSLEHIIAIKRQNFANSFYIPYYKLWLEHQILTKKITAAGYLENMDNLMVTESYTQCRFTGKNMPHIDPLKEIKAIREMLGLNGAVPLISREQASEMLGVGSWDENFMKYLEEENIIPKEEVVDDTNDNADSNDNTK